MLGNTIILILIGGSGGMLSAGGVAALLIGLGILRRFVGISHTASQICAYETAVCLGAVFGTAMTLFSMKLPVGDWGLVITGLLFGIFVGGWIMALAEILKIIPVFVRRLGVTGGRQWLMLSLALGKVTGSVLGFYLGWGKK